MKPNLVLIKLIMRLSILMLLFVMLFIISTFLYSIRYWPDVYNYVNANITITRIPTISELNLTVFEVIEYNTEMYSTTDADYYTNGYDTNTVEYTFGFEDIEYRNSKVRRSAELEDMGSDYKDVPKKSVVVDYFFDDEDETSTKLIKDLVDERKLTTRDLKDVEVMPETQFFYGYPKMTVESCNGDKMVVSDAVFPWVATIFVKNESKGNQFDYFCDGALISNKLVLTAARCTYNGNVSFSPEIFIVILGKTSLQTNSGEEKILRVKAVKRHENYTVTEGKATNDLAVLVLEETVGLVDGLATACLKSDEETTESEENSKEAITTAWSFSGDLTLIYFDKEKSKACGQDNKVENTFCATYRNDVALCPSYGGLYVTISADNHLHLQGLRNGNPLDRGICYDRNVNYTSLKHYRKWIRDVIESNK
ncbi:unnamed protein product, partial [Diatraea saccharalis]